MKRKITFLIAALCAVMLITQSYTAVGQERAMTTATSLAKWNKQSITANTPITANSGDANNSGVAKMTANKNYTSAGTNCYYNSNIGSGAEIVFSDLTLSGYLVNLTFYSRGSQKGSITATYSTDGTNYSALQTINAITTSEKQYTINNVPANAVKVKLAYGATSGSFYFGTPEFSGNAPSITISPATISVDYEEHMSGYGDDESLSMTTNIAGTNPALYEVHYCATPDGTYTEDSGPDWLYANVSYSSAFHVDWYIDENTGSDRGPVYFKVYNTTYEKYSNYVTVTQTGAPTQVATPTFSVDAGTYNVAKSVELSCTTPGATIKYSTDNGDTWTTYSTAIAVNVTTTIKAKAIKDGLTDSEVASATYTLKCATPTFSPAAGTYTENQSVEINCESASAAIHYTTDGSTTPTSSSPTYSSAISITQNTTIKAIAMKDGWTNSDEASATYNIKLAAPTFSPTPGVYMETKSVTLSGPDGATIKYTTDGSDPTSGTTYSSAISVSATTTIKAIAIKDGMTNSNVASATYTIATVHDVSWAVENTPASGTLEDVYINGIVSKIVTAYSSSYHNISFDMSDDGEQTGDQLRAYRCKGIDGEDLASADDIVLGDIVTVTGDLLLYNSTISELGEGCHLVYIKPVIKKETVELTTFSYSSGNGPSSPQSFTVRGRNLTENLVVTASSDYEVCATSDGTYTSSISLSTTNSTTKTVYVRLKAGLALGEHNGTITMTSADAVTQTINLEGSVSGYTVTYDANNATTGTVPTDEIEYAKNATVTVKTNSGSLDRTGYNFTGWNSSPDGSGTHYAATAPLGTFSIIANTTIYAEWSPITYACTITKIGDDASATAKLQVWNGSAYVDAESPIACGAQVKVVVTTSQTYYTYTLSSNEVSIDENGVFTMPANTVTVTVTTRHLYTITYPGSYTNGDVTELPTSAYAGASIVIETTPATNYYLYAVTASAGSPVVNGNNIEFTMPSSDVTITAITFARIIYTVTYSVNGVTNIVAAANVNAGDNIATLPTPASGIPAGFTFDGWTKGDALNKLTNPFTPTATETLYAIFKRDETDLAPAYVLVDSDLDDYSGDYLIVYVEGELAFDGSLTTFDAVSNTKGITIDNDMIVSNATTDAFNFTISSITGGYSIQGASGKYVGRIASSNGMNTSENTIANSISYDETNGCISITSNSLYLRYNKSAGQTRFRYFTNTNQEAIQLFKKQLVNKTVTKYYTFVLENDFEATEDVVITTPVIIPNGTVYAMNGYELTNTDPANLVIEDGGQLITSNSVAATIVRNITSAESKTVDDHWYTIASSVNAPTFVSVTNLTTDGTYDLYRYDEASFTWQNSKKDIGGGVQQFTAFQNGRGYLYRKAGSETIKYVGTINTGDFENYSLSWASTNNDLKGLNLIGNPFPHNIYKGYGGAIDDAKLSDKFYYLENNGTWQIGTYETPIKPGMGIMVQTNSAGYITIKDDNTAATAEKAPAAKASVNEMMFTIANSQYKDAVYAVFDNGYGLYKLEHQNTEAPMAYITQNNKRYGSAMMSDDVRSFNLNFKAKALSLYTLSCKAFGEFDYVHVIDRLTGEDIDILIEGEYSFIGTPEDMENRFIVKLGSSADNNENDVFVFQNGNDIVVNGEGELQIFDVTGRMISTQRVSGIESVAKPSQTGVYIFRIVGETVKTQKIVVE